MPKSGFDLGFEKEGAKFHLEFTEYLQIFVVGGWTELGGEVMWRIKIFI